MYSTIKQKIISTESRSLNEILTEKGKIYTFLNPRSYLLALDNKILFSHFDGIFVDGIFLTIAMKIFYNKSIMRRSFDMTSMAPKLFLFAEANRKTVYVVASQQEQVVKAIDIFKKQYPNLCFSGYRNGYFSSEEEIDREVEHIVSLNPDFLIVGMGTIMQERFLLKVHKKGYQGIGFTCGGFIHQTAMNKIHYFPTWANKLNLRFIYRIYKEKHVRKRALHTAFLFPIRFINERFLDKDL